MAKGKKPKKPPRKSTSLKTKTSMSRTSPRAHPERRGVQNEPKTTKQKTAKPRTHPKPKTRAPAKSARKSVVQTKPKTTKQKTCEPRKAHPKPAEMPEEAPQVSPPSALPEQKEPEITIAPPLYPKEPEPLPIASSGKSTEMAPDLDTLPPWEDRLRLRRAIFEDGLKFYMAGKDSPEWREGSQALSSGKDSQERKPGYFMVCAKDRAGKLAGAIDGHALDGNILSIGRSYAKDRRVRDIHVLLYAAALTGRAASYVVFSTASSPLSYELAGKLILLGRGFGMSAVPLGDGPLLFIRKVRAELEHSLAGEELAGVIRTLVLLQPALAQKAGEFSGQESVHLIPLPLSPDSREHLHELRDMAETMRLPGDAKETLESVRNDYVIARKDITPEMLS